MRINVAVPEAHVDAPVLDAALEAVTRLNESMLARGEVPTFAKALGHGVKWRPEPPGAEHFDHAGTVMRRKWGDCDDLAPHHAASLRHTGEDPGAKAIAKRSGPNRWHAVVQRSDGTIDDPSKRAGMGSHKGTLGGAIPLMQYPSSVVGGTYIIRPQIALRPVRGAMQARADLPWHWREHLEDKPSPTDYAMTALHTAPVAATALTGAIDGVCQLGVAAGFADEEHLAKLSAISDLIEGVPIEVVGAIYGDELARSAAHTVSGFFSSLAAGFKAVAPIISKAAQFVPGVGPVASAAIDKIASIIPSGAAMQVPAALASQFPGLAAIY